MGVGGICIAAAIGFGMVLLVIRRYRRKPAVAAPEMDPETLRRLNDRIEQDLTKLD